MAAPTGGLGCQGRCHSRPRATIRRSGTEAVMRIRRAPSRNPGDRLHVPTEQQLLFNEESPSVATYTVSSLFRENVAMFNHRVI